MDGYSPDLAKSLLAQLQALAPEVFSDGRLDPEALKRSIGEAHILEKGERYHLDWPGKSAAYKVLQAPTSATLRPQPEQSINFEAAEHVFIEGENLEVLKVLQKAYFGKVKLIYIDPPYNTGSDAFIYPDRFQESKADYLKRINELSDDGQLMREGFFRKNSKESGHFHSNWLNMMLPRLYLARNLLREDGVIFVSIDDNEVHDLRCLMNEVFGEENFIECFIWKKSYGGGAKEKHAVTQHEYILLYARSLENISDLWLPPDSESVQKYYKYQDSKVEQRGAYRIKPLEATKSMDKRENLVYPIPGPDGKDIWPKRQWWWSKERTYKALKNDDLVFTKTDENGFSVSYKQYLYDEEGNQRGAKPFSIIDNIFTQKGTADLESLFEAASVMQFPKPVDLVKKLIRIGGNDEETGSIYMDFFSGSCTTAQAIFELNREDTGHRKFLCVQLPEACPDDSKAYQLGYVTIADIARERIRRVIQKIQTEADLASPAPANLGFKSFTLAPSNFKQWRGDDIDTEEQLIAQLQLFVKSEKDGASIQDMLYELLLKAGFPLTTPIERLTIENAPVYRINGGELLIVLETFAFAMIEPLLALKPKEILCLDSVFQGSDELKSNLYLQCQDAKILFTSI